MTRLQKIGFSTVALVAGAHQAMAINFGSDKVSNDIKGDQASADVAVQTLVNRGMGFLYLLAVLYAIYGGVLILTAAGDDGKVKKGKTILFQALLGLIVIFLANSIVNLVITSIFGTGNR